ncbi:MAG TPA: DUF4386 domain-containing protein [Candidatus Limnocylindrales bacterium]|nr:DUF4386 domain-containing protein [Candidatus Limnocylindrales bacterium]
MEPRVAAGILLIVVPIVFNVAFFELGRAFDYPAILRRPPDEILRRFAAGGAGLLLRWHLLFVSALAMLPLAVVLAVVLDGGPVLTPLTMVVGVVAALVQGLGLARWVFAVPELARQYGVADGPDAEAAATRGSVEIAFAVLHRYLGVGVGEHLGYLATGLWTILVAVSIVQGVVLPGWTAVLGIVIGIALLVGTLEFVGPNERDGWALAGTIVPIAYIAWSIWLIVLGLLLLFIS